MSLTLGTGPFGPHGRGHFNFAYESPGHVLYLEPRDRRVRGEVSGRTVVDSERPYLLHETGLPPVYYFPADDVDASLLEPSDTVTVCPFKGTASYHHVVVGDRRVPDAVWSYPEPVGGAPPLAGLMAFYFDRLDRWFEEDEEIHVHPTDPYHRIDLRRSHRHVTVSLGGRTLADTKDAVWLFETGLPVRRYIPPEDVDMDALRRSDTVTRDPYKGEAVHYGVEGHDDIAWSYPDPLPETARIAGLIAFYDDRVDVVIDGEPQAR